MRRLPLLSTLFASLLFASPAFAADKKKDDDKSDSSSDSKKDDKKDDKKGDKKKKDDDDIDLTKDLDVNPDAFKDADDKAADTAPVKKLDADETEKEDDELDFNDDANDGDDLKFTDDDEQQSVKPRQPGEDTAQIYRDTQKKCKDMTPDEEQLVWEEYLRKYPKSLFKDRVETRMDELSSLMFGERVPGSDQGERGIDAAQRELNWSVPFSLSPIDTRSHISVGIQWGFPAWFGGKVDAEYAFMRQLSGHVLLGRDFAGAVVQPGVKYALIKSSRTGTLLSGGLDFKLNASPTFLAFHPVIGFGQRIRVLHGLDISAQIAADFETREDSDVRLNWGLHGELRPNETVAVFWEWSWDAKYIGNPDLPHNDYFRFFTTTFGLKFNASKPKNEQGKGKIDAGVGAVFPYATNYWGFYAGGVDLMGDFYL
jgi:hypothetical protein